MNIASDVRLISIEYTGPSRLIAEGPVPFAVSTGKGVFIVPSILDQILGYLFLILLYPAILLTGLIRALLGFEPFGI
jgi:hypothetical protein